MTISVSVRAGLVGVGYQGRDIGGFVTDLLSMGVTRLVDVRLNPISRKPGFSKTALGQALGDAGIGYEHRRELGNPRDNRAGFTGSPEARAQARAVYSGLLTRPEAVEVLDTLADASRQELVALLCFEADQRQCHRELVLQAARARRPCRWPPHPGSWQR
ncbi:DUF488 family protein [Plantactinospora sp. WMMB782]|uniref:DUF488 domain-containing protein n=1 Tax=Plantactinospora sp. WMMB782 TaxID=3404121 RepID=UPI003B95C126